MVDAIGRSSIDPWARALDADNAGARGGATTARTTKAAMPPPEVPELPDVHGALLARAARAAQEPRPLLASGIDAAALRTPDQDTVVQKRMDAFFDSAKPTYRLPADGGTAVEVAVATPFRMKGPASAAPGERNPDILRYVAQERRVNDNDRELRSLARNLGIHDVDAIKVGRGTPAEVHALTQALIDARKLPRGAPGEPDDVRVRRMMGDYGIGFDCAGFTQQAFLAAHGITRGQAGFARSIMNESLSHPSSTHFSRVAPEDARAGDILALGPPPGEKTGHRLVVFDRHDASSAELKRYCTSGEGVRIASGRVSVLVVDSSFGSGANPGKGGVQRQTWLYDPVSNQWAHVFPAHIDEEMHAIPEVVRVRPMPYDGQHPLLGVYHYSEKL